MDELKPCPFCGKTPEPPVDATRILGVWRVIHKGCTTLPNFAVERADKSEAIAAWNRRADLCADPALLAEAVEKFAALEKAATEVSRRGAETGPQWTKLTIALLAARAFLAKLENRHE